MTKKVKIFLQLCAAFVLVVLSIAFASSNLDKVTINYLFGSADLYISVAVFVALLFGGAIGAVFSYPAFLRIKRENTRLRKKLHKATQPTSDFRAIPLQKHA